MDQNDFDEMVADTNALISAVQKLKGWFVKYPEGVKELLNPEQKTIVDELEKQLDEIFTNG